MISLSSIRRKNAEFSVAVMEVPWEDASRFGLMVADDDDKITEFQEKPKNPKSNLASMGIYIFNWDILKKYLIEDENDPIRETYGFHSVCRSLQTPAISDFKTWYIAESTIYLIVKKNYHSDGSPGLRSGV